MFLRKWYSIILLFFLFTSLVIAADDDFTPCKNIILFIGDGMGDEHIKAAGMYANGQPGTLVFESFPHKNTVSTDNVVGKTTDSAAAATALATGNKVNNKIISQTEDGKAIPTILEIARDHGKSTGLTTTVYITHATPAGFGSHEKNRDDYDKIARDMFTQTRPNVLFGGRGPKGLTTEFAIAQGYQVVTTVDELCKLDTENSTLVSGQFGVEIPYEADKNMKNLPHLSQMTTTALNILDNDPDGFFIMIESGKIDWAAHSNDIKKAVFETVELAGSVQAALTWAKDRDDTLILVTADHETGGLAISKNNGKGIVPKVKWSRKDHSNTPVSIFSWGKNAQLIDSIRENTDIFSVMMKGFGFYE